MPIHTDSEALRQPIRWLASPTLEAIMAALTSWLTSRRADRVHVSPLSADWLHDLERRSIRGRE